MHKTFIILFLICLPLFFTGCIPVLIGAGAVAGYTVSNDSATGNVESSYRALWDLSLEILKDMNAEILEANESKGYVKFKASGYSLTLHIYTLTLKTQKLKVTARKYCLPKPQFAQKIFLKIVDNVKTVE